MRKKGRRKGNDTKGERKRKIVERIEIFCIAFS